MYQMMSALENSSNGVQLPTQLLLNSQQAVLQPPQQAERVHFSSFMNNSF